MDESLTGRQWKGRRGLTYKPALCCAVLSSSVMSDSFDRMDCSPPGSSVHGDPPSKNTGVGCHALLQGGPREDPFF